jgi:nudix-type nucleoside diphosphatase (YffH/AdpP family)
VTIRILGVETLYTGWLALHRATLRGDDGQTFVREIEHHGEGVAVLPYDPQRRLALMVRLPRAPVIWVGGPQTLLEAPAGVIEAGEDADGCARREALEEAGVRLADLEPVARAWPMPGISTELMHLFLAPYGAGDRVAPGGGVDGEHETIVVQEMALADLARAADDGGLADMKTLALVLALRLRRPELFGA